MSLSSSLQLGWRPFVVVATCLFLFGVALIWTTNQQAVGPVSLISPPAGCNVPSFNVSGNFTTTAPLGIAIDDFNKDGKPDVVAVNESTSAPVTVALGNGVGGFAAPNNLSNVNGLRGQAVATGDFNGDGNPDIVVGYTGNGFLILVFFGNGSGGFTGPSPFLPANGLSTTVGAVVTADFNGDGKLDIAAANSTFNSISVLTGNGSGGFTTLPLTATGGGSPTAIEARDVNGDSKIDLIVGNGNSSTGNLAILLGDGTAHFAAATTFLSGNPINSVAVADFDGDSKLDIVANSSANGKIFSLRGDGSGGFTNISTLDLSGFGPGAVRIADFNGDSKADLAVDVSPSFLLICIGNGAGAFTPSANYFDLGVGSAIGGSALAIGDFDGDTRPDVALANKDQRRVSVFLNSCGSSADARLQFNAANVAAFEEQGLTLAIVRTGDITATASVDFFTSDGTATSPADYTAVSGSSSFAAGDLRKNISIPIIDDNLTEGTEAFNLTMANAAGATIVDPKTIQITIFDNDPAPTVSINDVSVTEGNSGLANAVFVVSLNHPSTLSITMNFATADGTATAGADYQSTSGTVTFNPSEVSKTISVPVNGDIIPETNETFLVNLTGILNGTAGDVQGMATISDDDSSCPAPNYGSAINVALSTIPFDIVTADFNNDGRSDVAVLRNPPGSGANILSVYLGNGNSGFVLANEYNLDRPIHITVADLNGDGKTDLITANNNAGSGANSISVLLGDGSGGFAVTTTSSISNLSALAVADFNGDGKLDLALSSGAGSVAVEFGNGTGGFGSPTSYPVGTSPAFLAAADINNDGKPDLMVPNRNSANVSILLNAGNGTFGSATNIALGGNPQQVHVGDLNSDGQPDLIISNSTGFASVLLGNGAGGFSTPSTLTFGVNQQRGVINDLNGDGKADFAVADAGNFPDAGGIWILFGNGAGAFTTPVKYAAGNNPKTVVSGEFNGDGKLDLATVAFETRFSLLPNSCGGSTISLAAASYSVGEAAGGVTITVNRGGDASGAASVDYATSDRSGATACSNTNGNASSRCDYIGAFGTLRFAANELSKTVFVFVTDDSYSEGPETFNLSLSNPGNAMLSNPGSATITITDNDSASGTNPIDQAAFFVRTHYIDFLNRQPDQSGLDFWTGQITSCGADTNCTEVKRVNVSAAFFLSIEFQQTGYLVHRIYKVAYGETTATSNIGGSHQLVVPIVRFNEFLKDTQRIGQGVVVLAPGWEQALENNKYAYALEFVQTARFTTALPTTMTPTQFVDKLDQNAGNVLSQSERTTAINLFGNTGNTTDTSLRAQVLRQVAEDPDLFNAESNRAFVLAEYFGYLRRNPNDAPESTLDYTGYDFWLQKLNQFNGNYIAAEMVKAFIASDEYRRRFGP